MTNLSAAKEIQQQTIEMLMKESFEQLCHRPVREYLPPLPELRGFKLCIIRKPSEHGGVEISVEIQRRTLLIFMNCYTDGFKMLPDGKVVSQRIVTYKSEKENTSSNAHIDDLPQDIEQQIVEYLRLELGEDESDPDALKVSDLSYVGKFLIKKKVIHFWLFPCTDQQYWATVELLDDNYCISTTIDAPPTSQ